MITKPVLIDTGPLVAMLYEREHQHAACVEAAKELPEKLLTCWPVITEAAYLLRSSPKGVATLLSRIEAGRLEILPLSAEDTSSIGGILRRYRDQGFDFADACLMYLAEREQIEYVFTLDRRHFSVFRRPNGQHLVNRQHRHQRSSLHHRCCRMPKGNRPEDHRWGRRLLANCSFLDN